MFMFLSLLKFHKILISFYSFACKQIFISVALLPAHISKGNQKIKFLVLIFRMLGDHVSIFTSLYKLTRCFLHVFLPPMNQYSVIMKIGSYLSFTLK